MLPGRVDQHFPSTTGTLQIFAGKRREQTSIFVLGQLATSDGFDRKILEPFIRDTIQMHEGFLGQCVGVGFGRQHFRDFHFARSSVQ